MKFYTSFKACLGEGRLAKKLCMPKDVCLKDVASRLIGSRLFKLMVGENEGISSNVIVKNLHFNMNHSGSY